MPYDSSNVNLQINNLTRARKEMQYEHMYMKGVHIKVGTPELVYTYDEMR